MNTKTLIITEKPSVASAISAALGANVRGDGCIYGGDLIVSWCYGHLVELAVPAAYDEKLGKWRREDLPILPEQWKTTVMRDKRQQFEILRGLMQQTDVGEVVNACDAGREGELIFRLVYEKAGCTKPVKRLWLSSMEPDEISLTRVLATELLEKGRVHLDEIYSQRMDKYYPGDLILHDDGERPTYYLSFKGGKK